jgi:hypothetical protein
MPPFDGLSAAQKKELTETYIKFFWDMRFSNPPGQPQPTPGQFSPSEGGAK